MERTIREAHWGYYAFVLANGEVAEKGHVCCIDTGANGAVIVGTEDTGLMPVGLFLESLTGDGVKKVQVKLFKEIQAVWLNNDSVDPVTANDVFQLCWLKDSETVSISSNSSARSNAGQVLAVDAAKGVLVHFDFKAW